MSVGIWIYLKNDMSIILNTNINSSAAAYKYYIMFDFKCTQIKSLQYTYSEISNIAFFF
jgi:hypothetical protein